MDCSPPDFSIHGIFHAKVLEWGAIAFSNISNYEVLYYSYNYLHKSWYDGRKASYSYSLEGLDSFTFYCVFFQIQNDPEFKNKLKAQALIYPGLQLVDVSMPSHRENEHGPLLSRKLAIKLACLYLTQDKALPQAMMKNQHMPYGSMHLFKLVNWSTFLPEKYKKTMYILNQLLENLTLHIQYFWIVGYHPWQPMIPSCEICP